MTKRPQRLPSNPGKCYDLGFKNGASHGFDELRMAALSWLQDKYITDPNRPDRGSPEAKAILALAREFDVFFTEAKMDRIK